MSRLPIFPQKEEKLYVRELPLGHHLSLLMPSQRRDSRCSWQSKTATRRSTMESSPTVHRKIEGLVDNTDRLAGKIC